MEERGVQFVQSTRATDFQCEMGHDGRPRITAVECMTATASDPSAGTPAVKTSLEADTVVFAVGAAALSGMVRASSRLAEHAEFRRFTNLRGLSVLATRLFLDQDVETEHTANACWGFDEGVGMTWFDIKRLHGLEGEPGAVIEVDYYHSNSLLVLSDEAIIAKAKEQLDRMIGPSCAAASVVDAAIVRLPNAVNNYFPGSYKDLPDLASSAIPNAFFVGDLVRTRHGAWSQEKAYITGQQAANIISGRAVDEDVVPLKPDEVHVAAGRSALGLAKEVLGGGNRERGPSLVDFLW